MTPRFKKNIFDVSNLGTNFNAPSNAFLPSATTMTYTRGGVLRQYLPFILAALLILGVGFAGYSCANAAPVKAKVNGNRVGLEENSTIAMAVTEAGVETTPGRLLAIDGSVIDEAGGMPFTATVNGAPAKPSTLVADRDEIEISAGEDRTESRFERSIIDVSDIVRDETWGALRQIVPSDLTNTGTASIGDISGIVVETKKPPEPQTGILTMFDVQTHEKVVALTFDDGPWEETTEQILDILKENDAKATFFVVGTCFDGDEKMCKLLQREHMEGHQISTHSYSHAAGSGGGYDLGMMSLDERIEEVVKGQECIAKATGKHPNRMFRAPGGNFNNDTARAVYPYITYEVGWNLDTEDWRLPGADTVEQSLLSVQPGNIVLMHDGGGERSQTVEALRKALPQLKEQGWKFVTVEELLTYNEAESEQGTG